MSLISRIEVNNYLTEGISAHRRAADWKPMLTGITLRMDGGKSALINITNGGGKTSLVELLLYLLSRDARLLKRVREKVAPKACGFTHARIEFRTPPEDNYLAPSLLEIDPQNLPGETHVIGVVLNDDVEDPPIFYSYSGTLEDSPCYRNDNKAITSVPDAEFVARTKALRGCKWNKFSSRREWEDHVRLFLPVEVIRRNVVYQLKGSDDKNASFFSFTARPGESYDSAFFRAVVAPDLLSNLLSTFSEEDESAVEDTLLKSLTRIVDAEREIVRKEERLAVREKGIAQLAPILQAGSDAQRLKTERDTLLRELRKDIALLRHFGVQGSSNALPGLPRPIPHLGEQDPRISVALKGMVITRDDGILLLDKALSELTGVEVAKVNETASRKSLLTVAAKTQVVDFACDIVNSGSGNQGGGHHRRGYPRESAMAIPDLVAGLNGARTAGLKEALAQAFEIAERQIDTNPAALRVRQLQALLKQKRHSQREAEAKAAALGEAINKLELQIKDRRENQGAWDDFVKIGEMLPDALRTQPIEAKTWLTGQQKTIRETLDTRSMRRGELAQAWKTYTEVLDQHGLEGLQGAMATLEELKSQQANLQSESTSLIKEFGEANQSLRHLQRQEDSLRRQLQNAVARREKFDRHAEGLATYARLFGSADPDKVTPEADFEKAKSAVQARRRLIADLDVEANELYRLKSQAQPFASIFGGSTDPLTYDPLIELIKVQGELAAARESMAFLATQKEAIELFQDTHPGVTPGDWITDANKERERLEKASHAFKDRVRVLTKELEALEQMRSVEDGAFEQAWSVLDPHAIPVQRLHQVILESGLSPEHRLDALSALSGMLSAPVFDGQQAMQLAASALQSAGVSVPLILRDELLKAVAQGVGRDGETRWLGFIGGNTSRRVRILLDAAFAEAERERLALELSSVAEQLETTADALLVIDPAGEAYQLALRAKEAQTQRALERYRAHEQDVAQKETQETSLKAQTTQHALEVLRSAKEFATRGGEPRLQAISDQLPALRDGLTPLLDAETVAQERASQHGLNARDDARAYQRLGGSAEHASARELAERLADEQEELNAKMEEVQVELGELAERQARLGQLAEAFANNEGPLELERHQVAIDFAQDTEALEFMTDFEKAQKDLNEQLNRLLSASSVNFDRAEAFRANQDKSDEALQDEIARKQLAIGQHTKIADEATEAIGRINDAEIPTWSRLAKAIHELAYEVASRVARTRRIAEQARELEEGDAVPEAHPSYKPMEALAQVLRDPKLQAFAQLVEQVEAVSQSIQEMDLSDNIQGHKQAADRYAAALKRYVDLNAAFCAEAQAQAGALVTAFNELEIDEIRKATPETLVALKNLFEQLQNSLNKERQEAQQAKRVAEESSADTLSQLTQLIVSAEDNLNTLNKVMKKYPSGRFFFQTQINKNEAVLDLINELKEEVERAMRDANPGSRSLRRTDETQLKALLRDRLIQCVFTNTSVEFVNAGIWAGKKSPVSTKLSTGQKIALEFMWIVRQAEYEIERGLQELTSKQAAKSRAKANRVILVDGIFSTLSDRRIIAEALNGLRDLGGNFQIIGFLHSQTWNNDFTVFPIYHVGKKLMNSAGDSLVSFEEQGREAGTLGFINVITQASDSALSGTP